MIDPPPFATPALAALLGYGLGSIPFGLLLTRLAGLGDIRNVGSGNIGATNVLRTGRKGLAAGTLILDGGKGAAAALLGGLVSPEAAMLAGGAALLGHLFPVWLGFRGGKGVATALGLWLALSWPVGVAACATWLVVAGLFRFSSLAALVAIGLTPLYALLWADPPRAILAAAVAGAVIAKHHANIGRLIRGEEPKLGRKNTPPQT